MKSIYLILSMLLGLAVSQSNAQEICNNRIDDDGDGLVDCKDGDCYTDVSCWQCETEFYQVHSNTTIVALNPATGMYTNVATISGASAINGVQMNHLDGHVYAPCFIGGKHRLGMLSRDGTVTDLGLDLPGTSILYAGGVDTRGRLYIARGSGNIYYVDLTQSNLSVTATNAPAPGVADFSLDNIKGLFYGITGSGQLKVFNPFKESLSTYALAGTINGDSGGYGAAWSCVDGSFFAYNNKSGKIYSINVNDLTSTEVLNAVGNLSINDGFNCILAPPPFETNCGDGRDNDGDGLVDCEDGDCYKSNECKTEICNNGIDDDGDGWIDCSDSECFYLEDCIEDCSNGIDDNGNGLVDSNDPQCSAPSGVSGGLESNGSLADKIAERNYKNAIQPNQKIAMKSEGLFPFQPQLRRSSAFDMAGFIPTNILGAYVAESAPEDLVTITNATEVAAADYYQDEQRIGSILAIRSDQVYEHTKYICDRLDGSRLLDISHTFAHGGLFLSYELINNSLSAEYAVSFSAYHDEETGFTIENHWNLHKYPKDQQYYNFQIWARSYSDLINLLEATLVKMEEKDSILKINHSDLPRLFITHGVYSNGSLQLQLRNKDNVEKVTFSGSLRETESATYKDIRREVVLSGQQHERIEISVGYLYDMGASLFSDDSPSDEVFVADGRWGIDEDHEGARANAFNVVAQESTSDQNGHQVERGIELDAEVKDFLNVYRSLGLKNRPINVDSFDGLQFAASGNGALEVTLVKESINDWENQFRTRIELTGETKKHELEKAVFTSTLLDDLVLDDVVLIVFTLVGNNSEFVERRFVLDDLAFVNFITSNNQAVRTIVPTMHLYPNPVQDKALLQVEAGGILRNSISIYNSLGQLIRKESGILSSRTQMIELNLKELSSGVYFFSFDVEGRPKEKGTFIKQ